MLRRSRIALAGLGLVLLTACGATPSAPAPTSTPTLPPVDHAANVRAAVEGSLDVVLGEVPTVVVQSVAGGLLYETGAGSVTPASLMKLTTAAAALHELGPDAMVTTKTGTTATLRDDLAHTLMFSDNDEAAAIAAQLPRPVPDALTELGIPVDGFVAHDANGLSAEDRVSSDTLLAILVAAADPSSELAPLHDMLPRADSGTLHGRFTVGSPAASTVHAKTGYLDTGVFGLAGWVTDADGGELAFVIAAHSPVTDRDVVQPVMDRIVDALAQCACG